MAPRGLFYGFQHYSVELGGHDSVMALDDSATVAGLANFVKSQREPAFFAVDVFSASCVEIGNVVDWKDFCINRAREWHEAFDTLTSLQIPVSYLILFVYGCRCHRSPFFF